MGEDDDSEAEYWKDQDEPFLEDERDEDEAMKRREALMTKPARSFPQFSFHKIMYLFDSPSSSKVYHFGKWKISDMAAVKKNTIKHTDYIGGSPSIPDPRIGFSLADLPASLSVGIGNPCRGLRPAIS